MLEPDNPFVEDSPTRWDNAKDALLRLLDTFSHTDYINMVDFSDKADSLIPGGMVQATTANIERVKEAVRRVRPLGGTDFRRGLNKAFNLLTKASKTLGEEDVRTSNCQKVVIFLTDGQDCATTGQNCSMETPEGFSPVDAVLEFIDKQQQQLVEAGSERAHVFPISFGLDADDEIPKEIACANEGVWGRILSDDDPLVVLNAYTSYLASKRRDAGIVWTRQYEDEFGLGSVVTATKPIYSWPTSAGEFGALIGVVAHDVRIEDARALIPEGQSVVDRLVSRDAECVEADFSGCELQLLRGRAAECPETFMDSMCYYFDKTDSFYIAPQSPLLDFAEAQVYCESLGGSLAEIDEPDEEDLLSGLAPNSGSWIGLVRDEDFVWRWQSTGEEVSPASKVWTFMRELNDVGRACGRLDRRGVRHSVHPEDCDAQARFICEFTAEAEPHVCRRDSDLIRVDKDYRYSVRPLSTCKMEDEAFKAIRVATPEASSLPENRVICPLGEPSTTVDVQCCEGCTP
ncbi:unnamed protein product [Ostreobium quekettii]|uniref:C-type lectin n=1 Tax=Ostreobium quekettii TaxID=121088 RepID=A0A8S1IMC4_9CHLO|nr:unnamed protein product [Ostreobium quekettii]